MAKRKDDRPICKCSAYKFPHRIGGKCDGSSFTEYYNTYNRILCSSCNCSNNGSGCDVVDGSESIKHAECYIEACHVSPAECLPLEFIPPEEDDYYCDLNSHLNIEFPE